MFPIRRATCWKCAAALAFASLAGCERHAEDPLARAQRPAPPFGTASVRGFDFGPVVRSPGVDLEHEYNLTNESTRIVRISQVVNAKPCCGSVSDVTSRTLGPGETTTIKVKISSEGERPEVRHRVVVMTDAEDCPEIELYTSATIVPRLRIEPVEDSPPTLSRSIHQAHSQSQGLWDVSLALH